MSSSVFVQLGSPSVAEGSVSRVKQALNNLKVQKENAEGALLASEATVKERDAEIKKLTYRERLSLLYFERDHVLTGFEIENRTRGHLCKVSYCCKRESRRRESRAREARSQTLDGSSESTARTRKGEGEQTISR